MVQYPFCCGTRAALTLESATSRTRLGPECEGEHALLHCYKAADGTWLMLTATLLPLAKLPAAEAAATLHKLASAAPAMRAAAAAADAPSVRFNLPDAAAIASAEDDRLCAALGRAFSSSGSAAWWVQQLDAVGVRAVQLASFAGLREACTKPAAECNVDLRSGAKTFQFLRHQGHAMGGDLVMFAACSVRTCGGEGLMIPLHDAPRYGEHTQSVLRAIGADWRALVARKQAATSWCSSYLPGAASADPDATGRPPSTAAAFKLASSHAHPGPSAGASAVSSYVFAETGKISSAAVTLDLASCLLAEPTSPRADPLPPPDSCPICLDVMIRPVGLACSHQLCADCATKCSSAGLASCPVCRHPQLLDPAILARRSQAWRAAYSGWRRGAPSGSQGEVGSINAPAGVTAQSLHGTHLVDAQVSYALSAAGDLAICKKALPPPASVRAKGYGGSNQAASADVFKNRASTQLQLRGLVGMLSKPKRSFHVSASLRMPLPDFECGSISEVSLAPTCHGSPEPNELA
jgi:hypothetical protein